MTLVLTQLQLTFTLVKLGKWQMLCKANYSILINAEKQAGAELGQAQHSFAKLKLAFSSL